MNVIYECNNKSIINGISDFDILILRNKNKKSDV